MLASSLKVPKMQRPKALKIAVFDHPPSFDGTLLLQGTLEISAYTLYCHETSPRTTLLQQMVWVYLHSNFHGGLGKRTYLETECESFGVDFGTNRNRV